MVTSISHPTQKNYLENTTCSQLLIKTQEIFLRVDFLFWHSLSRDICILIIYISDYCRPNAREFIRHFKVIFFQFEYPKYEL